jgi:hypothetical protein
MVNPIDVWVLDGYEVAGSEINVDVYKSVDKVKQDKGVWVDMFFRFRVYFRNGLRTEVAYNPKPAYIFYLDKYVNCVARVALFSNSIWLATVPNYMEPDVWWVVRVGWGTKREKVYDDLLMWLEIDEERVMKVFTDYVGNEFDTHTESREFYKRVIMGVMFHEKFGQFRKIGGDKVLDPLKGLIDFIDFLEAIDG